MKIINTKKTTQELISLGMALHGDKDTMETRIRGIFSRKRSTRAASIAAMVLVFALVFACFTTACQPVVATVAAETAIIAAEKTAVSAQEEALLRFDGYAKGTLDGNKITVTDAKGTKHEFTWVDEGIRKSVDGTKELSEPIPEGTYAAPGEVALRAAETAVTVFGDMVPSSEIHINMYTGDGLEMVYYGIGFNGTPFESAENLYGYADAVTGTVLHLDNNYWGQSTQKYGDDAINNKVSAWNWEDEKYAAAHTSDRALATAMELIRTCFPTGEIVPKDAAVWDAGSHTDGEQIVWNGGYLAVVDAYIRMDKDPCYYVQVAVPLEESAEPAITIFGCYPLGWDYCCNQIHDPAVLREELAWLEDVRAGRTREQQGAEGPFPTEAPDGPATITEEPLATEPESAPETFENGLQIYADRAEALVGTAFTPNTEDWKEGDSASEYTKLFAVKVGAYLDDGYEDSDPTLDANEVLALSKRGNVLRFEYNGHFIYGICVDAWNMVWADASTMTVRKAPVAEWMAEKPDCTCSVLTWDW